MNHDKIYTYVGLAFFVLCIVGSILLTKQFEAERNERYRQCIEAGGKVIQCSFTAAFGVTHYEG